MESYELRCDHNKCRKCGTCEFLVYGFISKNKGIMPISHAAYYTEIVYESVRALKDACPQQAIDLVSV